MTAVLTRTAPARFTTGPATPPRTLADVLAETTARHPDAPALDDGTVTLTYAELREQADELRQKLAANGVGTGDRVGVRVPSGTADLYVSILGVLAAGAAYVPVDADDPDERAELVFGEAAVRAVLTDAGLVLRGEADARPVFAAAAPHPSTAAIPVAEPPAPEDDAWIIFTS